MLSASFIPLNQFFKAFPASCIDGAKRSKIADKSNRPFIESTNDDKPLPRAPVTSNNPAPETSNASNNWPNILNAILIGPPTIVNTNFNIENKPLNVSFKLFKDF